MNQAQDQQLRETLGVLRYELRKYEYDGDTKFTSRYGTTVESISLESIMRFRAACNATMFAEITQDSVFCHVGSKSGWVVSCIAAMGVKASLGFDISVSASNTSSRVIAAAAQVLKIYNGVTLSPYLIFNGNADNMGGQLPITHWVVIANSVNMLRQSVSLACNSDASRVLVCCSVYQKTLYQCGMLTGDPDNDADVTQLHMRKYGSAKRYLAYVFPLTELRKLRVLHRMSEMRATYVGVGTNFPRHPINYIQLQLNLLMAGEPPLTTQTEQVFAAASLKRPVRKNKRYKKTDLA
jgi:hypothetical protein